MDLGFIDGNSFEYRLVRFVDEFNILIKDVQLYYYKRLMKVCFFDLNVGKYDVFLEEGSEGLEYSVENLLLDTKEFHSNQEAIIKKLQGHALKNEKCVQELIEAFNQKTKQIDERFKAYNDCILDMAKKRSKYFRTMASFYNMTNFYETAYANRHLIYDCQTNFNEADNYEQGLYGAHLDCQRNLGFIEQLNSKPDSDFGFYEEYKAGFELYSAFFLDAHYKFNLIEVRDPSKVTSLKSVGNPESALRRLPEKQTVDSEWKAKYQNYFGKALFKNQENKLTNNFTTGDEITVKFIWPHAIRNYPTGTDDKGDPVYPPMMLSCNEKRQTHLLTLFFYLFIDDKPVTRSYRTLKEFSYIHEKGPNLSNHDILHFSFKKKSQIRDLYAFNQSLKLKLVGHVDTNWKGDIDWNLFGLSCSSALFSRLPVGDHKVRVELRYQITPEQKNLKKMKPFQIYPLEKTPVS